jgi:uncharacterized protein (DUF4415 family)
MKESSKTNWERIDALTDENIDTSDIPPLTDSFFDKAILRVPHELVSMNPRLDPEIVAWFKAEGGDWEQRMNAALRLYALSHKTYR